jgi:hypothetical protein
MKTAISLPDELFRAAERQARRAQNLARHAPEEVTDAMNRVVERLGEPSPEPFVGAAARRVFERTEW